MKTVEQGDDQAFANVSVREIKAELLEDDYNRAIALFTAQGMDEDEGWRTMIVSGLALFEGKEELAHLNRPDISPDLQQNLDNLLHRAMDLQAQYSVMKFKAFRFMQNTRVLEFNVAGLRGERALTEATIPRLREQVAVLKQERQQLLDENAALKSLIAPLPPTSATAVPPPETDATSAPPSPPATNLVKRLFRRN